MELIMVIKRQKPLEPMPPATEILNMAPMNVLILLWFNTKELLYEVLLMAD